MTEKAVEKFLVKLKFSPGNLIFGKNMGNVWHVHFFALLLGTQVQDSNLLPSPFGDKEEL